MRKKVVHVYKPMLLSPLRSIGADNYCKDSFHTPRLLSPLRTIGTDNYCKDSFRKPRLLSSLRSIGTDNYIISGPHNEKEGSTCI